MIFHSNSENVYFIGITLVINRASVVVIDINANLFHAHQIILPEGKSFFDMISIILDQIECIQKTNKGMALAGIGFNRCLYQQDYRRLAAFGELVSIASKKYFVPVIYADNDAILLCHLYRMNNLRGRAVGVVIGEELRMAEIDNRMIMEEVRGYAKKIRHWKIAPESQEKCYCGKKGCLECMLGYEDRIRRYCRTAGLISDDKRLNPQELYRLAETGISAAMEVLQLDALLIARLFRKIQNDLKFDHLYFFHDNLLLYKEPARQYTLNR